MKAFSYDGIKFNIVPKKKDEVESKIKKLGEGEFFKHRTEEKIVDAISSITLVSDKLFTIINSLLMTEYLLNPILIIGIVLTNTNSFINKFHTRKDIASQELFIEGDKVVFSNYYKQSTYQNIVSGLIFGFNVASAYNFLTRKHYGVVKGRYDFYKKLSKPICVERFMFIVLIGFFIDFSVRSLKTTHNGYQFYEYLKDDCSLE